MANQSSTATAGGNVSQTEKRHRGRPPGAKTGTGKKARARARALAAAQAAGSAIGKPAGGNVKVRNTGSRGRAPGMSGTTGSVAQTGLLTHNQNFFAGGNFQFAAEPWNPATSTFSAWRQKIDALFGQAIQAYHQYVSASANALTMTAAHSVS